MVGVLHRESLLGLIPPTHMHNVTSLINFHRSQDTKNLGLYLPIIFQKRTFLVLVLQIFYTFRSKFTKSWKKDKECL